MLAEQQKTVQLASKLNRLTKEGHIRWEAMHPPAAITQGRNEIIEHFFKTDYRGKILGLYEVRLPVYNEDFDRFLWNDYVRMGIFASDWSLAWEFEDVSGLADLFHTVRHNVADVDRVLDELLGDSDSH